MLPMRDNKRLDDLTERIGRLERKIEQHEANLTVLMQGLATWMGGMNDAMSLITERSKTMNADVAELCQHVRGKMEL